MRTSLKFMRWCGNKAKYTSSWSIVPTESYLIIYLKMDPWGRERRLGYSIKFYRLYSISISWGLATGTSNLRIFYSTASGT